MREDLTSVIPFVLDRHSIFICSIAGFRAINYSSPPPLCQHATFIYCAKYVNTYTSKSFCWHKGAGTICHKTFPKFHMFHCEIKFPFKRKVLPSHPSCSHLRQSVKLSLNFHFPMHWDWLKWFQFWKSWKSWHYWTYCHFCLMVQASISLWLLKPFLNSSRSTYGPRQANLCLRAFCHDKL